MASCAASVVPHLPSAQCSLPKRGRMFEGERRRMFEGENVFPVSPQRRQVRNARASRASTKVTVPARCLM